jgi:hypothetical protein
MGKVVRELLSHIDNDPLHIWTLTTAHLFTILLCMMAGSRAYTAEAIPRPGTCDMRGACLDAGAAVGRRVRGWQRSPGGPAHTAVPLQRTGGRREHMDDERHEGREDPPAPATPHVLARLASAVDVVDPTTLEQSMANWHQRRALLTAYISEHMQEGIDYYTLTIGGTVSKPSLSKAGSEKFLSLFNVHATFRKDDETWEMLGRPAGVICYICELYTKRGELVGEGRGAREILKEKDINKAIKMAQKSAQIDAVLRTGALSDAFTQDLDDVQEPDDQLVRQQKHRIVALLKLLGTGVTDKAGYEAVVQQYTGLALVPALYPDIIARLETRVTERLHTRAARGGERTGVASAAEDDRDERCNPDEDRHADREVRALATSVT